MLVGWLVEEKCCRRRQHATVRITDITHPTRLFWRAWMRLDFHTQGRSNDVQSNREMRDDRPMGTHPARGEFPLGVGGKVISRTESED